MSSATPRYNILRRLLHWIVAIAVILMIPYGLIFTDFDNKPTIEWAFGQGSFDALYDLHKSVGLTVLALALLRLLAAAVWPAPSYTRRPPAPARVLARLNHGALYAALVVVPILGWAGVSAFPAPLPIFWVADAPPIAPENREMSKFILWLHGTFALALGGLALIHIAAAFWHRNGRDDGVFNRIALFSRGPKTRKPVEDDI